MDAASFRTIRQRLELSQLELGTRMGRTQWAIHELEAGKRPITEDIANWMTKLSRGQAGASPPKYERVQRRKKTPPAEPAFPPPLWSSPLCQICLCVTGKDIPCGCWRDGA